MKVIKLYPFFFFLLLSFCAVSQTKQKEDTAFVNKLLQDSKNYISTNPEMAVRTALQAKEIAKRINFPLGEAYALKNLGLVSVQQGKYIETLEHWEQSLKIFQQEKDKIGIANLLNNIGSIYINQGDDAKALEYCLASLKIAEETGDKLRIMSALVNVGSIYHNKKDAKAIDYLRKALPLCEEMGNKDVYGIIAGNIGEIYFDKGDNDRALEYYNKTLAVDNKSASAAFAYDGIGKVYMSKGNYELALENHNKAMSIAEKLDDKMQRMRALKGIANTYVAQNDYRTAIDYYVKAKTLGEELKANVELKDIYNEMALTYAKVSDYPNALLYRTSYANIKDTLYNLETAKKLNRLQFDFDLSKKEGEIKLLTNEKRLSQVELQKQRQEKTAYGIGLVLLLLIALLIYRGYRNKAKTNRVLDRQKAEIQNLLSNILPEETAKELQESGRAIPRSYEKVSVLFSDFKNFTTIADKMSPEELVKELNICFVAFDDIIENNGLEKIKTIGDAYMCAGGIPTTDIGHPFRIVKAALEIQDYMKQHNMQRKAMGLEPLEMRIGIHVGPVVAGVVGRKKYAYDIWGNTVNIASRMETYGEAGKINISAATYELVKEKYVCTYRGKLYAKNVGDIDMYFVQEEITLPEAQPHLAKPSESMDDVVYAD